MYSIKGGIDAWHGLKATGEYESGMFLIEGIKTTEEFISLAMALEEGTRKFYENVKNVIEDKEAIEVFNSLVKAEEMHKKNLLEAYDRIRGGAPGIGEAQNRSLSDKMESGVSVDESLTWVKQPGRKPQEILEFSMQLETNSLDFYMKVRREVKDDVVQKTFNFLIEEEKHHLSRLGNMLNSMYNVK